MITSQETDYESKHINVEVYYFIKKANAHKFEDDMTQPCF